MISNGFESIWHFLNHRGGRIDTVQDRNELEFIYNLVNDNDCRTYLEVGTAEGNTLYTIGHALKGPKPSITYVDYAEHHTEKLRVEIVDILKKMNIYVRGVHGDSHAHAVIDDAKSLAPFDVVLIDGGHLMHDIVADLMCYAPLARKYIICHDIQLSPVGEVVDWYCKVQGHRKYNRFVNSERFGYGIIEVK